MCMYQQKDPFKKCFYFFSFGILVVAIALLFMLTSCNAASEICKTVDDILDDAVKVTIDKAVIQADTDVSICVDINNKDKSPQEVSNAAQKK